MDELKFAKNELFLCGEGHIKAQQEIDGDIEPLKMTKEQDDTFHTKLNAMIVEADAGVHKNTFLVPDNKKLEDIEKCLDGAWQGEIDYVKYQEGKSWEDDYEEDIH